MSQQFPAPSSGADASSDPLTIAQLCEKLDISTTTLWRLRRYHGLPTSPLSTAPRFLWPRILAWMEKNTFVLKGTARAKRARKGTRT
jgi:hypothetical protein